MISSCMQTYNSGKIAQTYLLASKVKTKLNQEAVKNNVDLHRLVCQANLLDNLIESLNHLEKSLQNNFISPNSSFSYETINSNTYPLLNSLSLNMNTLTLISENEIDDKNDDNDNDNDNDNDIDIQVDQIHLQNENPSSVYYSSDESDDSFSDDDDDDDDDDNFDSDDEYINNSPSALFSNDLCSIALQRLNIQSIECDSDSDSDNDSDNDSYLDDETNLNAEYNDPDNNNNTQTNITNTFVDECDCPLTRMKSQYIDHNHYDEETELPLLSNCPSVSSLEEFQVDDSTFTLTTLPKSKTTNFHIQNNDEDVSEILSF